MRWMWIGDLGVRSQETQESETLLLIDSQPCIAFFGWLPGPPPGPPTTTSGKCQVPTFTLDRAIIVLVIAITPPNALIISFKPKHLLADVVCIVCQSYDMGKLRVDCNCHWIHDPNSWIMDLMDSWLMTHDFGFWTHLDSAVTRLISRNAISKVQRKLN